MKKAVLISVKLFIFLVVLSAGVLVFNTKSAKAADPLCKDKPKDEVCIPTREEVDANVEAGLGGDEGDTCNNGGLGLSMIICPLIDLTNKGIASLTIGGEGQVGQDSGRKSILISLLELPPLNAKNKDGSPSPIAQIVGSLVTVANIVYVIVFLVLIFASSLPFNLDNYTVKKMLPKLIAAVILTQFSLVICGAIIDFFNLIGLIVPNILLGISQIKVPDGGGGLVQGVVSGVGGTILAGGLLVSGIGWILILIISVIALISVVIGLIYIMIRYFLLYLLVLVSPLAFVAWVFPGTSKFFTQWWQNFIRLNAMFVTVMALMSGSIVLTKLLANTETAPGPVRLIGSLMPIIALLLIPKVLKATTSGMNSLAAGALNFAGNKAAGVSKQVGSAAWKKAKGAGIDYKNKQAAIQFGKAPENSTRRALATLAAGNLPNEKGFQKMEGAVGQQAAEAKKAAELRYSRMTDPEEIRKRAAKSMQAHLADPNNFEAHGDMLAGMAKLGELGGGGRVELGNMMNEYASTAGASEGAWQGMLAQAGLGSMDDKAPEITGWEGTVGDQNIATSDVIDPSDNSKTLILKGSRESGINIRNRGNTTLGKLGASSVNSVARAGRAGGATAKAQFETNMDWAAAGRMAKDTTQHPEDAEASRQWAEVGRQGIKYWEKVGLDAAAAGDETKYDVAVQNQEHAQSLVDAFGG